MSSPNDADTREAIRNSAEYICEILNETIPFLFPKLLTPEQLIYAIVTSEYDIPDGKQEEMIMTIRALQQRLHYLDLAIQGKATPNWKRYWIKGRTLKVVQKAPKRMPEEDELLEEEREEDAVG